MNANVDSCQNLNIYSTKNVFARETSNHRLSVFPELFYFCSGLCFNEIKMSELLRLHQINSGSFSKRNIVLKVFFLLFSLAWRRRKIQFLFNISKLCVTHLIRLETMMSLHNRFQCVGANEGKSNSRRVLNVKFILMIFTLVVRSSSRRRWESGGLERFLCVSLPRIDKKIIS